MIHSKQDLKYYLNQDKLALHYSDDDKPSIIKDEIWKWEILLSKRCIIARFVATNFS